jgi:hypothetical protein
MKFKELEALIQEEAKNAVEAAEAVTTEGVLDDIDAELDAPVRRDVARRRKMKKLLGSDVYRLLLRNPSALRKAYRDATKAARFIDDPYLHPKKGIYGDQRYKGAVKTFNYQPAKSIANTFLKRAGAKEMPNMFAQAPSAVKTDRQARLDRERRAGKRKFLDSLPPGPEMASREMSPADKKKAAAEMAASGVDPNIGVASKGATTDKAPPAGERETAAGLKTMTRGRYSGPDLGAGDKSAFRKAFRQARKMGVPHFFFDRGRGVQPYGTKLKGEGGKGARKSITGPPRGLPGGPVDPRLLRRPKKNKKAGGSPTLAQQINFPGSADPGDERAQSGLFGGMSMPAAPTLSIDDDDWKSTKAAKLALRNLLGRDEPETKKAKKKAPVAKKATKKRAPGENPFTETKKAKKKTPTTESTMKKKKKKRSHAPTDQSSFAKAAAQTPPVPLTTPQAGGSEQHAPSASMRNALEENGRCLAEGCGPEGPCLTCAPSTKRYTIKLRENKAGNENK